jgi:hypothetical protein
MSHGKQAGGLVWVSHSDCNRHISTEGGKCYLCEVARLEAELAECRNYIHEIHSALSCLADENAVTYIQKTDQALVDRLMQVSTLKDENERLNASIETWRQMATPEKQLNDGFKAGMERAAEIEVAKPDVGVAIGAAEWLAGFRCGVRAKADAIRKEIK